MSNPTFIISALIFVDTLSHFLLFLGFDNDLSLFLKLVNIFPHRGLPSLLLFRGIMPALVEMLEIVDLVVLVTTEGDPIRPDVYAIAYFGFLDLLFYKELLLLLDLFQLTLFQLRTGNIMVAKHYLAVDERAVKEVLPYHCFHSEKVEILYKDSC